MSTSDESVEDLFQPTVTDEPSAKQKLRAGGGRSRLVLVVDDSPMIRKVLNTVITGMGHKVEEADNGTKALGAAMARRPDLVFLDLHMPEMNGFEMLEKWSKHPLLKRVPVVLLTSEKDPETVKGATRFGVSDYVSKPARPQKIREKVEKFLS